MYKVTMRDRLAGSIANWAMNHLATSEYRAFVSVAFGLGKEELDLRLFLEDLKED